MLSIKNTQKGLINVVFSVDGAAITPENVQITADDSALIVVDPQGSWFVPVDGHVGQSFIHVAYKWDGIDFSAVQEVAVTNLVTPVVDITFSEVVNK